MQNVKSLQALSFSYAPGIFYNMQLFKFDLVLKVGERMSFEG